MNQLDQHDGLLEEIRNCANYAQTYRLRDWNYEDDRIVEIRYEDLLADERTVFTEIFQHYGFSAAAIRKAVHLAGECSFKKVTGRAPGQSKEKSHLRSGRPGEWKEVLSDEHLKTIDNSFGDLLHQMGYI